MTETTLPLPGLSPVSGKALTARFDGGALSSDAGLLALREVERRLDVAGRLAACVEDPRDPARTQHSVADILRFRMLMIAGGNRWRTYDGLLTRFMHQSLPKLAGVTQGIDLL